MDNEPAKSFTESSSSLSSASPPSSSAAAGTKIEDAGVDMEDACSLRDEAQSSEDAASQRLSRSPTLPEVQEEQAPPNGDSVGEGIETLGGAAPQRISRSPTLPDAQEEQALQNGNSVGGGIETHGRGETETSSLLDNPPNIARIRQVMFECRDSIEISLAEFERYWPFIDNVWVKQRSNSSKEGHCTTDYYMCRLRRPTCRPSQSRPLPEGKRPRKKSIREGGTCNVQIKVVRFEGAYSTITISKTPGSSRVHSHDLDHIDKVKRNSGLMEFAHREAVKGYLPSSIFTKFQEEPQKLFEAGGRFLTATDVRNVSSKWRIQNPEVKLVPHRGYEYQQGHGIVKIQRSDNSITSVGPATPEQPQKPPLSPDTLSYPLFSLEFLEPYLPKDDDKRPFPHVTLSYASSMDSKISLTPGIQTVLSGPEAKLMTHFLRSRHDAILIGVGTVLADNPGLNCRLEGAGGFGGLGRMWQPRPVVIDPTGRWDVHPECRMLRAAVEGKGKAPWVIISPGAQIHPRKLMMLKGHGGDYLRIVEYNQSWRIRWEAILRALAAEGIQSVMIEGGGTILSELLNPEYSDFIDSIIVTVAPTYLGRGGVTVSPDSKQDDEGKPKAALNPGDVTWTPLGQNVIMCGKIRVPVPSEPLNVSSDEGSVGEPL